MASSNSQIDKPQRGRPKRAELPDININTGAQSINTESFFEFIKVLDVYTDLDIDRDIDTDVTWTGTWTQTEPSFRYFALQRNDALVLDK